jgi:hypothetical protein
VDGILPRAPVNVRRHRAGRLAVILILTVVVLAFLIAPAIHAAGTVSSTRVATIVGMPGLTKYLFATAAAGVHGAEAMLCSFALAMMVGMLLLGTAELVWRHSRRPDPHL